MTKRWIAPLVLLAMVLFTLAVWKDLPDRVPTHWNLQGQVDDTAPRFPGALLLVFVAAGVWVLLPLLRRIDPRRAHYERFDETFWLLVNSVVLFMGIMHVLVLGAALGWPLDPSAGIIAAVGVLFVLVGNFLPRIRSNWWMGIRTPWTLESEAVWRATHRLGGRTFVLGGLLAVLAAFLPVSLRPWVGISGLLLGSFVPVVYSYVAYRRERKAGAGTPG